MKHLLTTVLLCGCAAEQPAPQTSEVGVTVLPVVSSTASAPLARVTRAPAPSATPPAELGPEAAERYFTEARSMMDAGRFEQACTLFANSLAADPAIGTLLNLGECNEKLGNIEAACNAYRDVVVQAQRSAQTDRETFARSRGQKLGCR